MKIQQIYHKKNELFEVEFYKNEEFTEVFDFTNSKNIYINGQFDLQVVNFVIESSSQNAQIFIPYIPQDCINCIMSAIISRNCDNKEPDDYDNVKVFTLTQINKMWDEDKTESITPNLSKYIPEDNAVLFLSEILTETEYNQYKEFFPKSPPYYGSLNQIKELYERGVRLGVNKLIIFLPHGTQSELQKAEEVEKELMEKYGVEEVNLVVLHCFVDDIYNYNSSFLDDFYKQNYNDAYNELCGMECKPDMTKNEYKKQFEIEKKNHKRECYINKIITTNSTGILKPEDSNERLQVIDCKEIFEEYLKENN